MQTKKHTAWKKSRKFGDVMGGRMRKKMADNYFRRLHSLSAPSDADELPICMVENPSKDFYFPATLQEIKQTLSRLPQEYVGKLTHIWLRKMKKSDYIKGNEFQGCFICGSRVFLIILCPFPIDLKMRFGRIKPIDKDLNYYKKYTADLQQDEYGWFLQWTEEKIKDYYLNDLLLHEIGHLVDSVTKRFRSKATHNKTENFANNFVAVWGNKVRETFEG